MTDDSAWYHERPPEPDVAYQRQALAHQAQLTKPPGALGSLESLAVRLCALQRTTTPSVAKACITVFAADHGIAAAGVSAFPQSVTADMVRNFAHGGAAICVLARELGAQFQVVNLGTVEPLTELPGVVTQRLGAGTANFCQQEAMTETQLQAALTIGREQVADFLPMDIFLGGEMGIGNTTSASALAAVLLAQPVAELVGAGTGVDAAGRKQKAVVIEQALARHYCDQNEPLSALRCLGGFEIAALVGAYIACAQRGVPILVDGFISSVAALLAVRINPGVKPWLILSHCSQEAGHRWVIEALGEEPVVALGMRLGEASGAAVVLPLLKMACALHNTMATFAQAGIAQVEDKYEEGSRDEH